MRSHRSEFPTLASYHPVFVHLTYYLHSPFDQSTGISFIDSTPLKVCHKKQCGGLLAAFVTKGNIDDRTPVPVLMIMAF